MSQNVEDPTGGNGGAKVDQVSKNDNLNNGDGKVHNKGSWNSTDSDRPKWTYETKHVATYDYRRADGRYSYSVLKGRNPDGRKTFKVMRRNLTPFSDRVPGDKSEWFGGQGGEPSVLYRLPELITARIKDPGGVMVLILEGEKDVDTAAELGFVATTNPLGALKWEDSFSLYLAGTDSIVCPDADERGIEHAKRVAASVSAYAKRVRILRIPGYKDLTEWKEAQVVAGKTISEIAAELMVQIGTIKDVEETITLKLDDWLARDLETADYICGNWLTTTSRVIFTADTGLGKTLWSLALGLACAGGQPFMHWPASRPFRVLYVDGEMSRRVMKERLADAVKRLGQKPAGMHLLCHEDVPDGGWHPLNTPEGQTLIEKIIVSIGGIDLIIFDNIMALIEGDQKDEEGWRKTMPWIRKLTRRRIAQIWIHHTGHDATRGYGTKTREWQMDTVVHGDKEERADTDVSFKLTFSKARERSPQTRVQFSEVKVALVDDQWTWQTSLKSGALGKLSPQGKKFYEALCAATAVSGQQFIGNPAATMDQWNAKCVSTRLIDPKTKPDVARSLFSRHRRELIAANWIACNEDTVWTLGPNSMVGTF